MSFKKKELESSFLQRMKNSTEVTSSNRYRIIITKKGIVKDEHIQL